LVNYVAPGERLLLTGVRYTDYQRLADWRDAAGRRSVLLAYDGERLEIMTKSFAHERHGYMLGRLITFLCLELNVPHIGGRESTISRDDLERGFEPDEWFYLGPTAMRMTGPAMLRELDFRTDPPPDLAIEIEVSRSLLDRIGLYAAMGIREVWRFDGQTLTITRLRSDRSYEPIPASGFFPTVPLAELVGYLRRTGTVDDSTLAREFREWVRTLSAAPKS
jgi:Uma2 family endonuclease